jgi:hypothetical protein
MNDTILVIDNDKAGRAKRDQDSDHDQGDHECGASVPSLEIRVVHCVYV